MAKSNTEVTHKNMIQKYLKKIKILKRMTF